ncbi:MAG: GspH/FimT family pseudopilin [Gammaproteobacteria bacterium]|nr:GspH/FimT family pseudopilin [Gammaproteobacteria bacterium]
MPRHSNGYSLYELLLTTALIAALLTIGVPSFGSLLARQRQTVEINALFHAIHLARKESIMRRKVVSICPSVDGEQCLGGKNWSSGWLMFENKDRDSPPRVDAGEPILRRHQVDRSMIVKANRGAFTLRATFRRATNGTLVVCERNNRVAPRGLVVSYTGRPRVAVSNRSGQPYSCAD